MTLRLAISGFGRIGRMTLRAFQETQPRDIEIVLINSPGPVETSAHLYEFDSIHGRAAGGVKGTNTGSPQAGNGAVGRIRLDFNSRTGGDPQTQFYGHQTDQCAITLTGPA